MICLEIVKDYLILRMICLETVKEYLHGVSNVVVGCSSGWLKCTINRWTSQQQVWKKTHGNGRDGLGFFFLDAHDYVESVSLGDFVRSVPDQSDFSVLQHLRGTNNDNFRDR